MANQEPLRMREKETAQPLKRAYEKPACLSEKIFETTALACGKTPGEGGLCIASPMGS